MSSLGLIGILLAYMGFQFLVAQWAEKKRNSKWTNNAYVYSFSLAVYCTAWTYYGSIGVAAKSGLNYIPIYLGPVMAFPLWLIVLKKIIRISRVNKISSIADFISLRYGNSRFLGALVTIICIIAILPYVGLQLKAISETFHVVTSTENTHDVLNDTATYVAFILALFASFYGTRYGDASEKRKGVVTAIAMESVIKLFLFLLLGIYVTYFVFDGFHDIYSKASLLEGFKEKNTIHGLEGGMNWFMFCVLSLFAIFLLPRQFHMTVVENHTEKHVRKAIWIFPLYLLLFNIFVYPIAWGGNILFNGQGLNPDMFSLLIPKFFNNNLMTVLVFLGGFSAAISMIIVSSITLSTMLSNNFLIPYGYLDALKVKVRGDNNRRIVNIRRIGIFLLIILAYIFYRYFLIEFSLVSVGMISFVIIAQLGPSFFGALFWKRGSVTGAISGMLTGMTVCTYTIILPFFMNQGATNAAFMDGYGMRLLKPFQLFGLDYLEPIPHALFWSLLFNFVVYLIVSIWFRGDYRERNYAEMYVDINRYISNHENAFVWKGTAYIKDIEKVLTRFLGEERTKRALRIFSLKYNVDKDNTMADARLIKFAENLLTGHIGTASAKILIEGVTKEDKISLPEVLRILEESKENLIVNKKLRETSDELKEISAQLKKANESLVTKDKQKDEFLDTVTHELRTPITAIRAASEILHDDDEIPEALRKQFLQNIITESDRLNRLIDKILDLEKFETGKQKIYLNEGNLSETIRKAANPLQQLFSNKNISFNFNDAHYTQPVWYDEERIVQVITNLLSNAIKFCDARDGKITLDIEPHEFHVEVKVWNNGKTINPDELESVFDKFYQSQEQNVKKPVGSGLGLAISRQIIEMHNGMIWASNPESGGVCFTFTLPTQYQL
ncbi:MAG: sodium:proline symporter [Flavobacterium sp. BFFFF1]|uniref:ATP-binding protein n=1 Tax=Flavobacterium sp. BFFFF1 TaxID=2015557 RepID=UPI000BC67D6D|nr:ATP-binding protein [Flavobacterium sp. BFFFF1]OYU79048.1 MAG: sodium:proline symporter [Flavobacterium sp. BFFFF1]